MPIHDLGYRSWQGRLDPESVRPLVIASTGVKRTMQSRWLRRLMFTAMLPALVGALGFFLFEQAMRDPGTFKFFQGFVRSFPPNQHLTDALAFGPGVASAEQIQLLRSTAWSYLLLTLFRYPQSFLMILVVGIAAPPLISHDVRSRAFLIYFSRPVTRWEYIVGKLGTVAFFLVSIATVPALMLYILAVGLSPSVAVVAETWDLPLRILLASVVLIVPTTSVALMLSSLTTESRYAGFGWFAMWVLGNVTYGVMLAATLSARGQNADTHWVSLFSPYHTLGVVQSWVFGLNHESDPVVGASCALVIATITSIGILFRRVGKPMEA